MCLCNAIGVRCDGGDDRWRTGAHIDGTVLVHHGGIEMGQGIHVKMAQIVAGVLKVPLSDVRVAETSTEVVPNTSKTAAAVSVQREVPPCCSGLPTRCARKNLGCHAVDTWRGDMPTL